MSAVAAEREPSCATCSSSSSPSSSSSSYSSSSTDDDVDDPDYHVNSDDDDPGYRANHDDDDTADVVLPMPADARGIASSLHTQDDVDKVYKKYRVREDQYTARPAGDLRASSSPPPGAVCVYAHALEAGMRVPLHPFFCDALGYFGMAPTQFAPNGWRIMAGFVVLCHNAGLPPSLPVFRHFYGIVKHKEKNGWYYFKPRRSSGLRFAGLPDSIKGWKDRFFFLFSSTQWPCPVEWGEPSKSSFMAPVLTGEEKRSADILLRVHGAAPVDIRTCLRDSSLAAAMISVAPPAPPVPPTSSARTSAGSMGMDPSVYGMMKDIQAEKAAAVRGSASAPQVKIEPGPGSDTSFRGKKRRLDEAIRKDNPPSSVLPNSSPGAHGCTVPTSVCSPPPGFPLTPQHFASRHDDDNTDWETARKLLEKKPGEREVEIAALPKQLEGTDGELAAAKPTWKNAQATLALHELLGSEEAVLRRAERALEGYRRWKDTREPDG